MCLFIHKLKYLINLKFNLSVALEEKSGEDSSSGDISFQYIGSLTCKNLDFSNTSQLMVHLLRSL